MERQSPWGKAGTSQPVAPGPSPGGRRRRDPASPEAALGWEPHSGSAAPLHGWWRVGAAPGPNHGLQGPVGAAATPGHPPVPGSERSSTHGERGTVAGPQGQGDRDDVYWAGSCGGCSRAVPARGAAGRAAR